MAATAIAPPVIAPRVLPLFLNSLQSLPKNYKPIKADDHTDDQTGQIFEPIDWPKHQKGFDFGTFLSGWFTLEPRSNRILTCQS